MRILVAANAVVCCLAVVAAVVSWQTVVASDDFCRTRTAVYDLKGGGVGTPRLTNGPARFGPGKWTMRSTSDTLSDR